MDPWADADVLNTGEPELEKEGEEAAKYASLAAAATNPKTYTTLEKTLKSHLYRAHPYTLWACPSLKLTSKEGETEGDFRARLTQALHERRDLELEKLRKRYKPKLQRLKDRIHRAEAKVDKEQEQYQQQKYQTVLSFGATILGALFGRKLGSRGNVGRATTAARGVGRAARERGDIARAKDDLREFKEKLEELEEQFQEELESRGDAFSLAALEVNDVELRPRKSDISITRTALVWTPWRVDATGIAEPAFAWETSP